MEDTRVTFETAKLAKEKGFDALCYDAFNSKGNLYSNGWCEYLYDNKVEIPFRSGVLESKDVLAPTQSILAKWLREEHNIHIVISNNNYNKLLNWSFDLHKLPVGIIQMWKRGDDTYNTFEEAYEVGLQEALKLIDNK